jgi:hypothetical protein
MSDPLSRSPVSRRLRAKTSSVFSEEVREVRGRASRSVALNGMGSLCYTVHLGRFCPVCGRDSGGLFDHHQYSRARCRRAPRGGPTVGGGRVSFGCRSNFRGCRLSIRDSSLGGANDEGRFGRPIVRGRSHAAKSASDVGAPAPPPFLRKGSGSGHGGGAPSPLEAVLIAFSLRPVPWKRF